MPYAGPHAYHVYWTDRLHLPENFSAPDSEDGALDNPTFKGGVAERLLMVRGKGLYCDLSRFTPCHACQRAK